MYALISTTLVRSLAAHMPPVDTLLLLVAFSPVAFLFLALCWAGWLCCFSRVGWRPQNFTDIRALMKKHGWKAVYSGAPIWAADSMVTIVTQMQVSELCRSLEVLRSVNGERRTADGERQPTLDQCCV